MYDFGQYEGGQGQVIDYNQLLRAESQEDVLDIFNLPDEYRSQLGFTPFGSESLAMLDPNSPEYQQRIQSMQQEWGKDLGKGAIDVGAGTRLGRSDEWLGGAQQGYMGNYLKDFTSTIGGISQSMQGAQDFARGWLGEMITGYEGLDFDRSQWGGDTGGGNGDVSGAGNGNDLAYYSNRLSQTGSSMMNLSEQEWYNLSHGIGEIPLNQFSPQSLKDDVNAYLQLHPNWNQDSSGNWTWAYGGATTSIPDTGFTGG